MAKKSKGIPMASFTAPGRQKLINRAEVVGTNGNIDYNKLMRKVDKLGERLFKEARLLERI
jgi:hypothetical protein